MKLLTNPNLSLFHNPDCSLLLSHSPTPIHYHPSPSSCIQSLWSSSMEHISATALYSITLQFKKCIQRQVGRLTFHTQISPGHCWLGISSSSYAHPQKYWWEIFASVPLIPNWTLVLTKFAQLLSIGLIALLIFLNLLYTSMISHVSCITINPRGWCRSPANIAKITHKVWDLPDNVYTGGTFCKV